MRILFLTSAHNSLSQRLLIELTERGHEIRVCVVATGKDMIAAVSREAPDLIIAPMLKIAIPEEVWSRHLCLIVHPGVKGDRGPSSLDWAIANHEKSWGVTILEAAARVRCGRRSGRRTSLPSRPILPRRAASIAARSPRRPCAASSRRSNGSNRASSNPDPGGPRSCPMRRPDVRGRLRPPMRQADRAIDWMRDNDGDDRPEDPRGGQRSRRPRHAARQKLLSLWRA